VLRFDANLSILFPDIPFLRLFGVWAVAQPSRRMTGP